MKIILILGWQILSYVKVRWNVLVVARCSLIFPSCLIVFARCSLLFVGCLLLTRIQPQFIFSFLVLLKEMRTRDHSMITSCCYFWWCKSGELGKRESLKFPCVTPVLESFSSDSSSRWSSSPKIISGFNTLLWQKRPPPQMFNCIPNAPLIGCVLNVACR